MLIIDKSIFSKPSSFFSCFNTLISKFSL
jgi:solute carrier family 25 ornithine transporter 2/15